MNTYKLDDLKKISKEQGYKHVRLTDETGVEIVKFNPASMTVDARIAEMSTRLKSPALDDGLFCFEAKVYNRKDVQPDKFYIRKGKVPVHVDAKTEAPLVVVPTDKDHPLTYDQALKAQKSIATLSADLADMERQRDHWKKEYDSLISEVGRIMEEGEDEEDVPMSEGNFMTENMQKFLGQLSENLLPIAERHYDLKEKKLQIEEGKVISELAKNGVHLTPNTGGKDLPQRGQPEEELAEGEEMSEDEYQAWLTEGLMALSDSDPDRYRIVITAAKEGGDIEDLLAGGTGFAPENGAEVQQEQQEEQEEI